MTRIKNILNSLLSLLKVALDSAYYQQPIPSELDKGISNILVNLSTNETVGLELIVGGVASDEARILGLFAERMASLAVRGNSIEPVKQGLLALLLYARTEDPRDVLLILSLLHDAVIKTSGTPKSVFAEVSSIIGDAGFLNDFLNRSDDDKSIDAMGYKESKSKDGFLYVRTW